ncbi:hypothetical protein AAG570_004967 [Ranatra chinensis]|uniref:Uncharacterized protein n=1 Tax=Ranatra chinensis TaxID=642074 RepID=A0ABD0YMN4_9HEMI
MAVSRNLFRPMNSEQEMTHHGWSICRASSPTVSNLRPTQTPTSPHGTIHGDARTLRPPSLTSLKRRRWERGGGREGGVGRRGGPGRGGKATFRSLGDYRVHEEMYTNRTQYIEVVALALSAVACTMAGHLVQMERAKRMGNEEMQTMEIVPEEFEVSKVPFLLQELKPLCNQMVKTVKMDFETYNYGTEYEYRPRQSTEILCYKPASNEENNLQMCTIPGFECAQRKSNLTVFRRPKGKSYWEEYMQMEVNSGCECVNLVGYKLEHNSRTH